VSRYLSYESAGGVATLRMDDGKGNAFGFAMMAAIDAALDRAMAERAVVVLTGRPGLFCGGMDLAVYNGGGGQVTRMMDAGSALLMRLLGFPRPVMAACNGHAVGMGAILLLACDFRLAVADGAIVQTNEVKMGAPMPDTAIALGRARLAPAYLHASMLTALACTPHEARSAGYLDALAGPAEFDAGIAAHARRLIALDAAAFDDTKRRMNAPLLAELAGTRARDALFFTAKFGPADATAC
jgi:enoyl-CoA hydratase